MDIYDKRYEIIMKKYYDSLDENDKRRYAAIEVMKLEHGGQKYICDILQCNSDTILRGIEELLNEDSLNDDKIRKPGGGRKKNNR